MRHLESRLQSACVRWARLQFPELRLLLFSVPNGVRTSVIQAKIAYAEGMVAGVADLLLLYPSQGFHGLAIEMKTKKGRQSEHQKAWQEAVEKQGYRYEVIRTFEDFKILIQDYVTATNLRY